MKHGATLECQWLTTDEADGRLKEEHWRCGDAGEIGMTDIPMSSRLCIWRGRRGPYLDGSGREWQRREINLRFVLINLPKLALFRGEEGGPDEQTQAGAPPGFLGKVATPGVQEHGEGEEWKRKNPGETWQGSIAAPFVCLLSFCAKEIKNTPSAGAQLQC